MIQKRTIKKDLKPSYQPYRTQFIAIVSYLHSLFEQHQWILIIKDQLQNHVLALYSSEIPWLLLHGRIVQMLEMYTQWNSGCCFGFIYSNKNTHIYCGGKYNVLIKKVPNLSFSDSGPHVIFGLYQLIKFLTSICPCELFSYFMKYIANDSNFEKS